MTDIVIRAEGLSKLYHIGERERYATLRDVLMRTFKSTFAALTRNGERSVTRSQDATIRALKDVSFEIKRGEVVGIIGRNGAGKSTLLKILSRITEPTEGEARIYGRVGSLLEVGTGFHSELTGRENIYLNGAILGMKKAEIDQKFDEIVAFAEVEKFLDTPVKHYSSGMYMRLAFSVAAHLEPEIVIVDEVLAVGDAAFQKKCLGKMGEVAREGRTVLFVSHNMSAVLNLCQRTFLLERGELIADGTPETTMKRYLQNLQTVRSANLASHRDRRGRGRVRFSKVCLEDEEGQSIEQAMSGQTIRVALHYASQLESDLLNCRISIAVEDPFGQTLFVCSTEMTSREPKCLPPTGTIRCSIERLPLSQGQYHLTLFLEVNHEVEDWLSSAMSFDVVDGDFFGSGRQYPQGWQGKGVLVPHRWDVAKT